LNNTTDDKRFIADIENLPASFPTQRHSAAFWENLGRTVATFGFLEEAEGGRRVGVRGDDYGHTYGMAGSWLTWPWENDI
jgi:hypothetical protein